MPTKIPCCALYKEDKKCRGRLTNGDMVQKAPLATGILLNRRYRIVHLLGQGGFGAVYRAWELNLNRPCAVKENTDISLEATRQFTREASLLANLSHPNLPRVTDHFSVTGQGQYLVMDFIDGEDLRETLEKSLEPLIEEQVLPWIIQVCDALTYLHSLPQPIIHRDIKPANIRITPQGKAFLVDFGIAKIYDAQLHTTSGAKALTPGYSPPEQYGQGRTDARSDVYALGATLYTLLTGQKPPDSVDMLTSISPKPLSARTLNSNVSPALSVAIEKAMQLERNLRYQSIAEFKNALLNIMALRKESQNRWRRIGVWVASGVIISLLFIFLMSGRGCQRFMPSSGTPNNAPTVQPLLTGIMQRIGGSLTPATASYEVSATPWSELLQEDVALTLTVEMQPTQAYLIYLREGPGRDYLSVDVIRNDTRFSVIGRNRDGDWLYIVLSSGEEGWAFAEVITYYTGYGGEIEALPTVRPMATPQPTLATPTPP